MESFWPTLPFKIPGSQGVPLWWDVLWWVFQVVAMGGLLYVVTRWALKMDRLLHVSERPKDASSDSGQSLNN